MKLVVIIVVVHAMVMGINCQDPPRCYEETQYGPSPTLQNTDVHHTWNATNGDGVYNASVLCLDEHYKISSKSCFNGLWFQKDVSNCYDFVCPKPFVQEDRDKCVYTATLPKTSDACPSIAEVVKNTCNDTASCTSRKCTYTPAIFLETPVSALDINVTLVFQPNERKLLLTVYSPEALDEDSTRCYTNYVEADLLQNRKLVNVSKIYDSRLSEIYARYSLRNLSVFELGVEGEPRQYWCHVHQITKPRPVTTAKIVAYERKTENEYTIRVNVFRFLIEENVRSFCKHCRMAEVLPKNQMRRIMVLHLATNGTKNVTALTTEFKNRTSHAVWLLELRSSDFCQPDVTVVEAPLHWEATPAGSWARPTEICDDVVVRKCERSFLHGAQWGTVQGKCSGSNRTQKISNILDEVRRLMMTGTNLIYRNATSALLNPLEKYVRENVAKLRKIQKSNVVVRHESNVEGLALYDYGFKRIHERSSFNKLNTSGLELAVFLPENLTELLVTVFRNDRLFPGWKTRAGSDVVRVGIPESNGYLESPIIVTFKAKGAFKETTCGIWDEEVGEWSSLGADSIGSVGKNVTACAFSRLGHFTLVVPGEEEVVWKNFEEPMGNTADTRFNKLLLIVYGFSALGVGLIVGFVLTAVLVKWCRRKDRNK